MPSYVFLCQFEACCVTELKSKQMGLQDIRVALYFPIQIPQLIALIP